MQYHTDTNTTKLQLHFWPLMAIHASTVNVCRPNFDDKCLRHPKDARVYKHHIRCTVTLNNNKNHLGLFEDDFDEKSVN